jgi:hypothetical protein
MRGLPTNISGLRSGRMSAKGKDKKSQPRRAHAMLSLERNERNHELVAINDVETEFRARMRLLARKGGAVTKRRHGGSPAYYRRIGRLGGQASAAARKARIAAQLGGAQHGAPTAESSATPNDAATPVCVSPPMTLAQVLAELESSDPTLRDTSNQQKSRADEWAERQIERFIADVRYVESDDETAPWDPWR